MKQPMKRKTTPKQHAKRLKTFSYNFKYQRTCTELSQTELAQKLGTTKQTVFHYEHGMRYPGIDILMNLCEIFDCTPDELLL